MSPKECHKDLSTSEGNTWVCFWWAAEDSPVGKSGSIWDSHAARWGDYQSSAPYLPPKSSVSAFSCFNLLFCSLGWPSAQKRSEGFADCGETDCQCFKILRALKTREAMSKLAFNWKVNIKSRYRNKTQFIILSITKRLMPSPFLKTFIQ